MTDEVIKDYQTDLLGRDENSSALSYLGSPRQLSRVKEIWAIGGGKGGVGKSLVASSLAIALSRLGKKVIAVDLDLGGANLHTTLGIELPKQTLGDFLNHRTPSLRSCLVSSSIPQLELISGGQDSTNITNIRPSQKNQLLKQLDQLEADYLIFDLGAGTSFNTLDFFLYSDLGFLVVLPEPTSIENAYRFIKSAYFRHLAYRDSLVEIRPLVEMAMDPKNPGGIRSPADLFREVARHHPSLTGVLKKEISQFRPKLIINQARTPTDVEIGFSIKTVCKKYFGIEMDYLGHLDYDSSVWQAVRRKKPFMLEFPNSKLVANIETMTRNMLKRHEAAQAKAR